MASASRSCGVGGAVVPTGLGVGFVATQHSGFASVLG